jgi:N-acetylneuraminic acid mutarotase
MTARILPSIFLCISAFVGLTLSARAQTTAPNEWTWIAGSNSVSNVNGQPGVYGTLGTPAAGNIPGRRDSAATWTDNGGNFWLFGGEGADANGNYGGLNDLWKFQPSKQEWTWIAGSSTLPASCIGSTTIPCGQPGVYGNLGFAAAANAPGARVSAVTWTDSSGNFWLFGGYGLDANQAIGELNDLWELKPTTNEWAWMGGSNTLGSNGEQPGVYGTLGSAAAANTPGGRDSAAAWTDTNGNFWLFGGEGADANGNFGQLNDVWELDPTTNKWAWMGGSSAFPVACATPTNNGLCGWPAVYGALGTAAPGIGPGSRVAADSWTDTAGNFWLFGGVGSVFWENRDFSPIDQYDLWEFNPSTKQWAWMSGNSTSICGESTSEADWCGQDGIYGTEGVPAIANIPPSRSDAITWADATGNLWLLGGSQSSTTYGGNLLCDDFWVFEPAANEWAWMNGTAQQGLYSCLDFFTPGTYGTLGTPTAASFPSGRVGAASWTDSSGNLWLFGALAWHVHESRRGGAAIVGIRPAKAR